jgi:hypothetical protein
VRAVRVAAASAALVVGLLVVFLAHDVRSWNTTISNGRLQTLRTTAKTPPKSPSTMLPAGIAGSLLDVSRDRQWLDARQKFALAYAGTLRTLTLDQDDYRLLNGAEAALSRLTQDPNPVRASRAYNLLATLVFREAYPGPVVVRRLVQESLTDEQNAVRLDNDDEAAKENLELTLRVLIAVDLPPQQARAAGTRRANAKKGGFQGPPGAGY